METRDLRDLGRELAAELTGEPARNPSGRSLADLMDGTRWDYDPAQSLLSPLTATALYFESFPWEGEDDDGGR